MTTRSPLGTIPFEVLDQITLLLPMKSLLALSLTSRFLSTWSIRYIYHTVRFPCTAGSFKASMELHQRLTRDENLALLIKRLEFGRGGWQIFDDATPDLLKLLKKLPNLKKLVWRIFTMFDDETIDFILRNHPTLQIVLHSPIKCFENTHAGRQAMRCLTHFYVNIVDDSFDVIQSTFEALRGFNYLQHLELDLCEEFIEISDLQRQQLMGRLDPVLSRLKYLSISGCHEDTFRSKPILFVSGTEGLNLSRLERLEVNHSCISANLYRNPTVTGLKYLLCTRPPSELLPVEAAEFQCLLCRNKDLEELHIVDSPNCSELSSLSPLGRSLRTLDLRIGSYELGIPQFATLASLLPHLADLSASVKHDATWPYTSLVAIADSFPKIRHLHLRTTQKYLCGCCTVVHRNPEECPESDDVIPKIPATTLDLVSKSWQLFWDVLVSKNKIFLPPHHGPVMCPSLSPCIKSLVLSTDLDPSDPYDFDPDKLATAHYRHTFRADRSELLEDSRCGIATVSSQTVEAYETSLRDYALGTEAEDFLHQSKKLILNKRQIYRKVAEWGYDNSVWPDKSLQDLPPDFGRPRLVVPERTEVGVHDQAATAPRERLGLVPPQPRDEQSEAVQGP